MKHLSINPKATLLLNDTIFSLQVRLVESFFVSKYFRQRFLHETPTQLTAHTKNVTFIKTKHGFHMTSGLCVSTIMQRTISTIALSRLYQLVTF